MRETVDRASLGAAWSPTPRTTRARSGAVVGARYRAALRATVAASAVPYGYTLTIWTSGAVLSHARRIPSAAAALLFLAGAVAAYALVAGTSAAGKSTERLVPEPSHASLWGGLHLFSVGMAIGAAWLDTRLVTGPAAWPLGGFSATALYLALSAGQLALAHTAHSGNAADPPGQRR